MTSDGAVVLVGRRRGAIEAARRLGVPVVLVEPPGALFPARAGVVEHHTRPFESAKGWGALAADITSRREIRGILGVTEGSVLPAARLRVVMGLGGFDVSTALRCTDKLMMKEAVRAAGIRAAEARPLETAADEPAAARMGFPLVVKQRVGSGGRGLRVVETPDELRGQAGAGRMVETFVRGREMSVESLVIDGRPVFVNPTEYHVPRWSNIVPAELSDATRRAVLRLNAAAITALGVEYGMTHLELFLVAGEPVSGEIGARPPGGHLMELIALAYGFDPWEAYLRIACGEPAQWVEEPRRHAGVQVLHPGAGHVVAIHGADEIRARPEIVSLPLRIAPGDVVGERVGSGNEVGHAVAVAPDRAGVVRAIEEVNARLRIEVARDSPVQAPATRATGRSSGAR